MFKTIAIDFDGVIHRYSKGWHDGSAYDVPMEEAFSRIQSYLVEYHVYILSTRDPEEIEEWLKKHKAPFKFEVILNPDRIKSWDKRGVVGITNRKLIAALIIDDRALRFQGWNGIPDNLQAYVQLQV